MCCNDWPLVALVASNFPRAGIREHCGEGRWRLHDLYGRQGRHLAAARAAGISALNWA
jgi:hypothetical protein